MNKSSIYREWTGGEVNSQELVTELGAELTIADALRRASLGLSFDLPDHDGIATDDDFDHEDPTNVIGMDVDEAYQLAQVAREYAATLREKAQEPRRKPASQAEPINKNESETEPTQ